jgi:hypothetical protein
VSNINVEISEHISITNILNQISLDGQESLDLKNKQVYERVEELIGIGASLDALLYEHNLNELWELKNKCQPL